MDCYLSPMQTTTSKITVLENNFNLAVNKLEIFKRRCDKKNFGKFEFSFSEVFYTDPNSKNEVYEYRIFTIIHPEMKMGDWDIIGKIENLSAMIDGVYSKHYEKGSKKNSNIISQISDDDVSEYNFWDCSCEHCGVDRFRKKLMILKNKNSGIKKVVGMSCLKDFVGHDVEKSILLYSFLSEFNGFGKSEGKPVWGFDLDTTLKGIIAVYDQIFNRKNLKLSQEQDYGLTVGEVYVGQNFACFKDVNLSTSYVEKSLQLVKNRIAEIMMQRETDHLNMNTFDMKISSICLYDFVPAKLLNPLVGFTTYFLSSFESRKDKVESNFIGEVGKKINFVGKVVKVIPYENDYGVGKIIVGEDENGNSWKWFTNSDTELVSYERGAYIFADTFVNLSATVKKHDLHEKFGKSTILNRLKVSK